MIKVICGLKGSGKTTYIQKNMDSSIAYDLDYVYSALTFENLHNERNKDIALFIHNDVRKFLIENYEKANVKNLYVARAIPSDKDMELFKKHGAEVYALDVDVETIKSRLMNRDGELPVDFYEMVKRFDDFKKKYKDEITVISEYDIKKMDILNQYYRH